MPVYVLYPVVPYQVEDFMKEVYILTTTLRCLLFMVSVLSCTYALRRIRRSQMQIDDALFWIIISILLVFVSIFPGIALFFSKLVGIESPANAVFLVIIFLLLTKLFGLSVQVSQLNQKIRALSQEMAFIAIENKKKQNG